MEPPRSRPRPRPNQQPQDPPQPPRPRLEFKLATVLCIIATVLAAVYHRSGGSFLPQVFLLPVGGQVLSRGVIAFGELVLDSLARLATRRSIPIDVLTAFIMELEPRIGGALSIPYVFVSGCVTLFLTHTPEVLLGTVASGKGDVLETGTVARNVTLASYGGGLDRANYYTSGLLLLSSTTPFRAYREIGYPTPTGWVLPRKPTVWYAKFAQGKIRKNDHESRLLVPRNDAVKITSGVPANAAKECTTQNATSFEYWLAMHVCREGVFGFEMGGLDLDSEAEFFRLSTGVANVRYASLDGNRIVSGDNITEEQPVNFPRFEQLWSDMGGCFLNALSFNRPRPELSNAQRLAISSVVRIAGLDDFTGFSTPPRRTVGYVTSVSPTNLSRVVVYAMFGSLALILIKTAYFAIRLRLLAPELEQLLAAGRGIRHFLPVPRYARVPGRGLSVTPYVRVVRDVRDREQYAQLVVNEDRREGDSSSAGREPSVSAVSTSTSQSQGSEIRATES